MTLGTKHHNLAERGALQSLHKKGRAQVRLIRARKAQTESKLWSLEAELETMTPCLNLKDRFNH